MTEYLFPASIEEAIQLLEACPGEARIIAGGTDILPDIRKRKIGPSRLIDITRIPDLNQIKVTTGIVEVGAAVTFSAITESPFLSRYVHALVEAARCVGTTAIQNAATWVGNIVQAMPAADGAIVALALEAEACVVDSRGANWCPVEKLFNGPGVSAIDPSRQFVTHLRFPWLQDHCGTGWTRIGRRPDLVLPILNCAVKLCLNPEDSRIMQARIALGPVAPRPFRARQAESVLKGQPLTAELLVRAAQAAQVEASPRSSIMRASREYRLAIIPVMVGEALSAAAERAQSATT